MSTLIVPCAGGRRSLRGKPMFLQRHPDGTLLAEKAIQGIHPGNYDRIIFTILKDADINHHASSELMEEMGSRYPIDVLSLPERTHGPAATIYETIRKKNVQGEFVVRDSHNHVKIENTIHGNFVAGLDLLAFNDNIHDLRSKSFVVTNDQGQILDVIEKKFRSDIISVGLYGFHDAKDFCLAYERLSDINYPLGRMYVSHIISYLIGYSKKVFHCIPAIHFEDWGSPVAWADIQHKYATCFLNLDSLFGTPQSLHKKIEILSLLTSVCQKGLHLVPFTSGDSMMAETWKKHLLQSGIHCTQIITQCRLSSNHVIINNPEDFIKGGIIS